MVDSEFWEFSFFRTEREKEKGQEGGVEERERKKN